MTNTGFRALMVATILRAVIDVQQGIRPVAAYNFLCGDFAGQMLAELGVEQRAVLDEMRPIVDEYRANEALKLQEVGS